MLYQTLKEVVPQAVNNCSAVPQFNINGYSWIEAIMETANLYKVPIIIGVTDRNVERLGGYRFIRELIDLLANRYDVTSPLVLHLDHGQSIKGCKSAIDAGFSSVMFDGSSLPIEENIASTKEVVAYAHSKGVTVEGEIGGIGGVEDGVVGGIKFADVDEGIHFVKETGVDLLAAALGSVHGEYQGEPDLQFDIMDAFSQSLEIPMVLHGASGISESDLKKAISFHHGKINFNTELNIGWASTVKDLFVEYPNLYDPKVILNTSKNGIKQVMESKLKLCNLI